MTIFKAELLLAATACCMMATAGPAQVSPPTADTAENPGDMIALSLEEAIKIAQSRSFRAARTARNQQIAELRYKNAKSGYYPRADIRANADQSARGFQYDSDRFTNDVSTRGEFRSGVYANATMPLDLFGVVKRQVSQADLQRHSSGHEVRQSLLDVTLEAQNNYLNALKAQTALDADQRVVAEIEELLIRSRSTAPSTVPFLQVELGNAQQSLTSTRTSADQAQDGLRQTLRLPPETKLRLTSRVTERTEKLERGELLQRALAARPDIQQSLNRVKQAEISERQVSDSRKPNISLGGFYADNISARSVLDSDRDRFRNHGAGINASVPLLQYDAGQLGRQRQTARIQKEQAQADAEELQEKVGYEVRQALLAVQRAENRIKTLPDPEQAYQALKRAEEAMVSAPDAQAQALLAQVSNARSAWRTATTASADAYIDYNNAVFRLKRTIGEGFVSEEAVESPQVVSVNTLGAPSRR